MDKISLEEFTENLSRNRWYVKRFGSFLRIIEEYFWMSQVSYCNKINGEIKLDNVSRKMKVYLFIEWSSQFSRTFQKESGIITIKCVDYYVIRDYDQSIFTIWIFRINLNVSFNFSSFKNVKFCHLFRNKESWLAQN